MDMRMFWSILAAFGVIIFLAAIGSAVQQYQAQQAQAQAQVWHDFQKAMSNPDPMGIHAEVARRQRVEAQRAAVVAVDHDQHYRLADDQHCIAGTVITIKNHVYTQETGGGPQGVRCSGRMALEPLR